MQWSQIDIPAPLQVSASLGGMVVGLALLVAGYRLWKYTIFMIGFVIFGASIGFAVFAASSADCALCHNSLLKHPTPRRRGLTKKPREMFPK